MTSSLEQSFKKRLQHIAKERNITPASVWQNVILERFLVRLCRSPHKDHFILKGGTLLARFIDIGRETIDLDFSVDYLTNEPKALQKIIEEVIQIDLDDSFIFANVSISPLEHVHMHYPGARIKMEVRFGKARFPLYVDLGFGDLVKSQEQKIPLLSNSKGPLFEASVKVKCYPLEFVLAEKLETVVYRGDENSRMKDFHDLLTLTQAKDIVNNKQAEKAIQTVFTHRNTPLNLPLQFDSSSMQSLQRYWSQYLQGVASRDTLPQEIGSIIETINNWLKTRTSLI